jgi:hypothetical protein
MWLLTSNDRGLFLYADDIFRTRHELDGYGSYFATQLEKDLISKNDDYEFMVIIN